MGELSCQETVDISCRTDGAEQDKDAEIAKDIIEQQRKQLAIQRIMVLKGFHTKPPTNSSSARYI